jgi:hypothetical protein
MNTKNTASRALKFEFQRFFQKPFSRLYTDDEFK